MLILSVANGNFTTDHCTCWTKIISARILPEDARNDEIFAIGKVSELKISVCIGNRLVIVLFDSRIMGSKRPSR